MKSDHPNIWKDHLSTDFFRNRHWNYQGQLKMDDRVMKLCHQIHCQHWKVKLEYHVKQFYPLSGDREDHNVAVGTKE
jgi:hypothetical protein